MSSAHKHGPFDETVGSSLESFLEEEGIVDEVYAIAINRVTAWQEQEIAPNSD